MRRALAFTAALLLSAAAHAEKGDLIVALEKDFNSIRNFSSLGLQLDAPLVEDLGIVLVKPQFRVLDTARLAEMLRQQPGVRWVQEDHEVQMRETIPNDPDFARQWSLKSKPEADIAATFAWDIGKGGKDAHGNDVVMVVVDQGIEVSHPALVDNIWVNAGEIADNGIDDDQNGYVDDIHGWDAVSNSATVPAGYHATHVAGIMGARGNDSAQVVGVNWDAKIMTVRALGYGGGDLTSVILRAYGYVMKQKQIWLETEGQAGANVVVTNSSFGVDYADCTSGEYPAWNDVYDAMGALGILSAAATANIGIDVDVKGDVPTGCSSPYIISVTNTQADGTKAGSAGWGATTIDIGAPGTNILSTYTGGAIRELTGTSMATPHVAGAVGFLHSVGSEEFRELYNSNPGEAALALKQVILQTGSPQADLEGKTVSGRRLNLQNAALGLATFTQQ